MAKRKKTSPAEDIMDLVAMLPWWAGVALALILYIVLHKLAAMSPNLTGLKPGQMGGALQQTMIAALAYPAQFILPFLCLVGAIISFVRRRKRQALVQHVTQSKGADALNGMSWREFEMLVGEAFRQQGYAVVENGGNGPDGGVDLVLRKGGETHLVQCKQWKAFKVGVDVVRELYGVMAARGAARGFVVTSGTFTAEARAFAEGRNLTLVDGSKLLDLIQRAKTSLRASSTAKTTVPAAPPLRAPTIPSCPRCSAPMVLRTAGKGANPGSRFWGCSTFPSCRGTLETGI